MEGKGLEEKRMGIDLQWVKTGSEEAKMGI